MKLYLLSWAMFFSIAVNSQGFNNDYKYDDTDLRFLFKQNGVDVFKFPFRARADTSINIILEEFRAGQLTRRINYYEVCKPVLAMIDEPFTDYFPNLKDTADTWLRLYFKNTDSTINITPLIGGIQTVFKFDVRDFKMRDLRAFDSIPIYISRNHPLVVFYANKSESMISCPGDLPVSEIIKMYDFVLAAYIDLIPSRR